MAKTADVLSYLPPVFSEVYEMQAAAQGENSELNLLWQGAEDLMNDQFIDSATENGVSRWEKMLLLSPGDTDTLPERKFRIQSAMSGRLPFTIWVLREQLDSLCGADGYELTVDYGNYKVTVLLALAVQNEFDAVTELLQKMLPANLVIEVSVQYRRHSELTAWGHEDFGLPYPPVHPRRRRIGIMATNTVNYNLKKLAPSDFYNIADFNGNADIIDAQLKSINDQYTELSGTVTANTVKVDAALTMGVRTLSCTKSGNTFKLTLALPSTGMYSCIFTSPSDYMTGDSFTVNGTIYAVSTSDGEELPDKAFVSGAVVPAVLDQTSKTINFKQAGRKLTLSAESYVMEQR